jgi:Predicted Rossmann fold nucleotide-binding protein involved in DNA uptake
MVSSKVVFIPVNSYDFPKTLRDYKFCPEGLYVTPPISLNVRSIAIVGSRECSSWGCRTAFESGRLVVSEGFVLVTGLADGIDLCASLGALSIGGLVIGVRPWLKPLNLPRRVREVVGSNFGNVVLVSEYYIRPSLRTKLCYFMRNRIIAGMSELVVVVEARPNGGTMHQLVWAVKQGKPLAIYKHPDVGSDYYKAYEEFIKYDNVIILNDVNDLRKYIEEELLKVR